MKPAEQRCDDEPAARQGLALGVLDPAAVDVDCTQRGDRARELITEAIEQAG